MRAMFTLTDDLFLGGNIPPITPVTPGAKREKDIPPQPSCFPTETDWRAWYDYAYTTRTNINPCRDCTPGYKRKMEAEGKCGNPKIVFVWRTMQKTPTHRELVGVKARHQDDWPAYEGDPRNRCGYQLNVG